MKKRILALAMALVTTLSTIGATPEPVKAWLKDITIYDEIKDQGTENLKWNTIYTLEDVGYRLDYKPELGRWTKFYKLKVNKDSDIKIKATPNEHTNISKKYQDQYYMPVRLDLYSTEGKKINYYQQASKLGKGYEDCIRYIKEADVYNNDVGNQLSNAVNDRTADYDTIMYKSLPKGTYYLRVIVTTNNTEAIDSDVYKPGLKLKLTRKNAAVEQIKKMYVKIHWTNTTPMYEESREYKWTSIKGATAYQIKYNNKIYTTKETKFSTSIKPAKNCELIYVRALKDKKKGPWTAIKTLITGEQVNGNWYTPWTY